MASHSFSNYSSKDSQEINHVSSVDLASKMHVPKRISVLGVDEDDLIHPNGHHFPSTSDSKYDMRVPDRILVVGQDRHVGMKAPPHELVLENSILPVESFRPVRVQVPIKKCSSSIDLTRFILLPKTPPRSITVDSLASHDGSAAEEEDHHETSMQPSGDEIVLVTSKNDTSLAEPPQLTLTSTQLTEEVFVLRQQIGRLHRRMAAFEREQHQRQQRDALMVSLGAVYLVWKVILWLTRST